MNPQPKPTPREKKLYRGLQRKGRLRARGRTSHARRPRDFDYMGRVAELPCMLNILASQAYGVLNPLACSGRVTVDHAFGRYHPNSDLESIPLCEKHHREKTGIVGGRGFMAGWSLAQRRGWLTIAVAVTKAALR